MSGFAAGCGRSAGRNGRGPRPDAVICARSAFPDHKAREWASSGKGYWRIAGSPILARALPNIHWADLGLKGLYPTRHRLKTTT